jgi:hypothetical protein
MIILIWFINFGISWFNAWSCGRSWNETKHIGGFLHFMNWMGAVMSACGFTWCYLVITVTIGGQIPVEQDNGTMAPALSPEVLQATADLGFMLIYFPIVGSGIVITLQAWAAAWKRRTALNMGVAAWDTFAMVYNIRQGFVHIPGMWERLGGFFGSSKSSSSSSNSKMNPQVLVVLIVAATALAGILTTYAIVTTVAGRIRKDAALQSLARG